MARMEKRVTLTGDYSFTRRAFSGFSDETVHIYKMTDSEGAVYVWKTTAFLKMDTVNGDEVETYFPHTGDVFVIKASIKGETEYKGEPQTEVNRVTITEIISKHEDEVEAKAEKQRQSIDLAEGDRIVTMAYRGYKQHYADCETIEGSYDDEHCTIKVIVRSGRMKPSGVRGERFKGYELVNEHGEHITYRAVCEENALKRAHKEYPDNTWECTRIYDYRGCYRTW